MSCFQTCYTKCINKIGFRDVNPFRFVLFQCRFPPILYIIYRLCLPLYTDICFICKIAFEHTESHIIIANDSAQNRTGKENNLQIHPWWAYLTYWTYLMLCLYMTWHFFCTLVHLLIKTRPFNLLNCLDPVFHKRLFLNSPAHAVDHIPHLCWYFKISWVLFSIATVGSILVTLLFFVLLWPSYKRAGQDMNWQLHVMNSIIVGIELFFTAIPLRFCHVTYVLLYGIAYFIFTAIYYLAVNRTPIYSGVIDWSETAKTIGCMSFILFCVIPILQGLLVFIQKGKFYLYKKIKICLHGNENEDMPLV